MSKVICEYNEFMNFVEYELFEIFQIEREQWLKEHNMRYLMFQEWRELIFSFLHNEDAMAFKLRWL